jgi:hypothetical protein
MDNKTPITLRLFIFVFLVAAGCAQINTQNQDGKASVTLVKAQSTISNNQGAQISAPTSFPPLKAWFEQSVPDSLKDGIKLPEGVQVTGTEGTADLKFGILGDDGKSLVKSRWVFALVAPFPTVVDNVQWYELEGEWKGRPPSLFAGHPLLMTQSTESALEAVWGTPGENSDIKVVPQAGLLEEAWQNLPSFAIVPFEQLEPRWKVLRVEGISPLDKNFDEQNYKLTVPFGWTGSESSLERLDELKVDVPASNRDLQKMTVLVMTGTTALTRAIALRMEQKGIDYPAAKIGAWLKDADLTHVSNEVAFSPNCPYPKIQENSLQFCSDPKYIRLLNDVGVDIVELTGNHILNWDLPAFKYTLQLYKENNIRYFGGGENLSEARQPLLIEQNGNKLAFIGCNPAGPTIVWATEKRAGGATCDYDWMKGQIASLRQQGYLPVITLQYPEAYDMKPGFHQKEDFDALSDSGAVIVSGSQAHYPQGMTFLKNGFVHYGLGNLFFDQMHNPYNLGISFFEDIDKKPIPGVRIEVIDRHVFYAGKYLGVELLTAVLEDYSQPRPMTGQERESFLQTLFKASGWNTQ